MSELLQLFLHNSPSVENASTLCWVTVNQQLTLNLTKGARVLVIVENCKSSFCLRRYFYFEL